MKMLEMEVKVLDSFIAELSLELHDMRLLQVRYVYISIINRT